MAKYSKILSILAFTTGTAAQAQQVLPIPNPPVKAAVGERVICRSQDEMGSRTKTKRQCLTASEWRRQAREAADDIDKRLRGVHSESGGG